MSSKRYSVAFLCEEISALHGGSANVVMMNVTQGGPSGSIICSVYWSIERRTVDDSVFSICTW